MAWDHQSTPVNYNLLEGFPSAHHKLSVQIQQNEEHDLFGSGTLAAVLYIHSLL